MSRTIHDLFPSKYLRASDLSTPRTRVTIKSARTETLGQGAKAEQKLVVVFHEFTKPLVLNKTNYTRIAELTGAQDWDEWPDAALTLVATTVEFQGKITPCIRIDAPPPVRRGAAPVATPATAPDDIDDALGGDTAVSY